VGRTRGLIRVGEPLVRYELPIPNHFLKQLIVAFHVVEDIITENEEATVDPDIWAVKILHPSDDSVLSDLDT